MIGKKKLFYWDSCIFFRWIDRKTADTDLLDGIDKVIKLIDDDEAILCSSVIVHIEASQTRLRNEPVKLKKLQSLFDGRVIPIQVDSRIAKLAAEIRDFYAGQGNTLSTPDVIHLACAIQQNAVDEFHTIDGTNPESGRGKLLKLTNPIAEKYTLTIKVPRLERPPLLKGATFQRV